MIIKKITEIESGQVASSVNSNVQAMQKVQKDVSKKSKKIKGKKAKNI